MPRAAGLFCFRVIWISKVHSKTESCICAIVPPSRHTVAEVAYEIADECLTEVKSILKQHVSNGGIMFRSRCMD